MGVECGLERDQSLNEGFTVTYEGMVDLGNGLFRIELMFSDTLNPLPKAEFDEVLFVTFPLVIKLLQVLLHE